ncbi:helix-turn-helix domain-containing protein [Micromonospora sp. NPDC049081]|uniref:helix-turn-helix domain-containing protein n=1 Tax=Micromonospora sp. NPDC049081 TaxID=3155150 RepID=UPI0033E38647
MRGRTNNLTIGERVAWYRYRRGLSQEVLAGLIGRTADWLGKVENNRIELDRLSVIKSLAEVLDVPLGDLLGEPALLDWTSDSGTATVPALRAALMNYRALGPFTNGPDQEPRASPHSRRRSAHSGTPTRTPASGTSPAAYLTCSTAPNPPPTTTTATTRTRPADSSV